MRAQGEDRLGGSPRAWRSRKRCNWGSIRKSHGQGAHCHFRHHQPVSEPLEAAGPCAGGAGMPPTQKSLLQVGVPPLCRSFAS